MNGGSHLLIIELKLEAVERLTNIEKWPKGDSQSGVDKSSAVNLCHLGFPINSGIRISMSDITLESTLTCPNCGHRKTEVMPTDACQYYYECEACHTLLKPNEGDCCVFCSFGTVKCPPIQEGNTCHN